MIATAPFTYLQTACSVPHAQDRVGAVRQPGMPPAKVWPYIRALLDALCAVFAGQGAWLVRDGHGTEPARVVVSAVNDPAQEVIGMISSTACSLADGRGRLVGSNERWLLCAALPFTMEEGQPLLSLGIELNWPVLVDERVDALLDGFRFSLRALVEVAGAGWQEAHRKGHADMVVGCACCHRVKDDTRNWLNWEEYVHNHVGFTVSHTICEACAVEQYGMSNEEVCRMISS